MMQELIETMEKTLSALHIELGDVTATKVCAARARKLTLELAELGKQFRKDSIAFHKK